MHPGCLASGPVRQPDPEGSVFSGGAGDPYLLEAVGECFWPKNHDTDICDDIITITDHTAFHTARRVAREEGLLVGGSSGMAVAATLQAYAELTEDDTVAVLLPDSGKNYLSKIFNDTRMTHHDFLPRAGPTGRPGDPP